MFLALVHRVCAALRGIVYPLLALPFISDELFVETLEVIAIAEKEEGMMEGEEVVGRTIEVDGSDMELSDDDG